MSDPILAFIGGSGLYSVDGLLNREEVKIDTPFGSPSDLITIGDLANPRVAFLPRHGRNHHLSPTSIPVRANIYALKMIGIKRIVSISAVGSLKEDIPPLDLVIPDQIIDRTKKREQTFFEDGIVAHVSIADPFCPELRHLLTTSSKRQKARVHSSGTYLVIEGPQFSTKAESLLYRSWDSSVIGMTAMPEAKLAREAEICYATLALVTDYDTWHESTAPVTVEIVIENMRKNTEVSQAIVALVAKNIEANPDCACQYALRNAIITQPEMISEEVKKRLSPILG